MKRTGSCLTLVCLCVFTGSAQAGRTPTVPTASTSVQSTTQNGILKPPPLAPVRPVTDEYFGTKVVDPYRYLENVKDPEVAAWFRAQNDYTHAVLARIPGREELRRRIKEIDESTPAKVSSIHRLPGERYFYLKRLPTQDVAKLYVRTGLEGRERLLVDPAKYAEPNGPHYSISYFEPSWDGGYVAFGVSPGGSEDAVLHILETATGRETGETIDRAMFGFPAWLPEGRAFLYNRLQKLGPDGPPAERLLKSRVYLHTIGADPEKDTPVLGYGLWAAVTMEASDLPAVVTAPGVSDLLGVVVHGAQNEITLYTAPIAALGGGAIPWRKICDVEDEVTWFVARGDDLFLVTHRDAPRFKIVRTKLSHPDLAHAQDYLPQQGGVLRDAGIAQDALYVQVLDGCLGRLIRIPFDSDRPEQVALPFDGSVNIRLGGFMSIAPSCDPRIPGLLLELASWTKAHRICRYDPATAQITDTKLQPLGPFDDPPDLESEEVKVKSYDGTLVPLSLVHRRGLTRDGHHPTLLMGYGAYGISIDPPIPLLAPQAWLERGGVLAIAHVRGGGECGEDWHRAGMKLTKPNSWRDFLACAEYLIDRKYTSPQYLGGMGASAGGITIGRAITERPELFAAAISLVGCSNPLRAELMVSGPANIPEFGTATTQAGFEDLYRMDSYHHARDAVPYPAVLLTAGANDPRVTAWEPGKMAARLQAATASGKPVLLRMEYEGGHASIGSTKTQRHEETADIMSFLLWQLGAPGFQPPE